MKKRLIILGVAIFIVAALVFAVQAMQGDAPNASRSATRTTEVKFGELTLSISASGTVQSESSQNVFSSLPFKVDAVFVQEGQHVERGDVLAQLDTESLELDIRQQLAALDSTETHTDLDIDTRLRAYQDAQERSSHSVSNSRRSFELLESQVRNGTHPELINAQAAVDNTRQDLDLKTQAYEDSMFLFELGELSRLSLENSVAALEASQRAFDVASTNQRNLTDRLNNDVETARRNYQITLLTSQQEVANAENMYEMAMATSSNEAARINLERLENQLRDAAITAPISGVVTSVYAREGNPGNGLLFIIDDLQSLEIVTRVREFDVTGVRAGMPVIIRSDATGEREIQGTVKSIAPTSERTPAGATIRANVVEYETIVTVDDPESGLKVGMNTRISIILDTREDIYHVPYDAVLENADDSYSLLVLDGGAQGRYTVRSIPVSVGLETDFSVEISGPDVFEGQLIVSNPLLVAEGAEVRVN